MEVDARSSIVFYVNSRRCEVSGRDGLRTLADFLRRDLALTGTKVVCAEGDCGACTVLVGEVCRGGDGTPRYKAVNSCLLPLYAVDASHVITVEGLKVAGRLHPVQTALIDNHATQCGYCTPGFACAMTALVEEALSEGKTALGEKRARNGLTGNLCRCTGYESILKAAQSIPLQGTPSLAESRRDDERSRELASLAGRPVAMESGGVSIFIPVDLQKALELKKAIPGLKVVGGATDTVALANKGIEAFPRVLSLRRIEELRVARRAGPWAEVGAAVTLGGLQPFAEAEAPELGRLLHVFASPQIKNRATLVGNAVNASPIGDLIPFLMVSGAELDLRSLGSSRRVALEDFYHGYRTTDLRAEELVAFARFLLPTEGSVTRVYKASRRKDLDISAVVVAVRVELEGRVIRSARVACGGVAATVVRLKELERDWTGAEFGRELFERSARMLPSIISPISDVRGSKEFRLRLCGNLLLRFYDETCAEVAS